jgi:hypothetical protein
MSYGSTIYSNNNSETSTGFHRMADGTLMIGDYHTDTFNYTPGDAFLNSGQPYIGYYNISDNKVFASRVRTAESTELVKQDNIKGNFIVENTFLNRGTSTEIQLPHDEKSLLFQPSEFVNQNTINLKLDRLYENYLELYNLCFIRDNNIPRNYTSFLGCTGVSEDGNPIGHLTNVSNVSSDFVSNSASGLADARGFDVIGMRVNEANPLNSTTPDSFLTIFFTTSAISIFKLDNTGSDTTATFIVSTNRADGPFSQKFQQITDITTNNRDTLYVSDSFHNQIYRLYIDPILNESRIDQTNFDLINAGGLKLNTAGTDYLSGANLIYYYADEIYTWNDGRKSIIVLADNLSKIREFPSKYFQDRIVADFAINPIDSRLYILFTDFTILKVDALFQTTADLIYPRNVLREGEVPRRILFSQNDSNLYYIITSYNVYKYLLVADQDDYIGAYRWSNVYNVNLSGTDNEIFDAKILPESEDRDSVFLYDKNTTFNGLDRVLRFNESNELVSNLHNDNFNIFDKLDINVKEEYFNNITFNKSIKKILFNLDSLASRIEFGFLFEYDTTPYRLVSYTGNVGLSSTVVVEKEYDYFVGINEVITPEVFNRCISKLYSYQSHILGQLRKRFAGKKYQDSEIVTF